MGPIHTPRTLFYIGRGLARRQRGIDPNGLGHENSFVTTGRAGIFDCDYQMHLNNAGYLSYAEYARWELCAYNGLMQAMFREKMNFVVGGTTVRFRREVRPLWRKFEVHTHVAHLDDRNIWIYHTFRYPSDGKDPGRIRAQVLCQGLMIQDRKVLEPAKFLLDKVGFDPDVIDKFTQGTETTTMTELMDKYTSMEEILKKAATEDDELLAGSNK